jgi:hypothetical protein
MTEQGVIAIIAPQLTVTTLTGPLRRRTVTPTSMA